VLGGQMPVDFDYGFGIIILVFFEGVAKPFFFYEETT
jgi:hypothetical protein